MMKPLIITAFFLGAFSVVLFYNYSSYAEEISISSHNIEQLITEKKLEHLSKLQIKALKKLMFADTKFVMKEQGEIDSVMLFYKEEQSKDPPKYLTEEERLKLREDAKGVLESLMFFDDIRSVSINKFYMTNFNFIGLCKLKTLEELKVVTCGPSYNSEVNFVEDGHPWTGETLIYLSCADSLKRLSIPYTHMTDKQAAQLARFQNLQYLDLNNTRVSSRAMEFVCLLKKLEYLDLRKTGIDSAGIEKIKHLPLKKFGPPFRAGIKTFAEWKAIFPLLEEIMEDDKYQSLKK